MNAQIVQLEAMRHRKVQKLLPWVGQGTLTDTERKLVEEHLASCSQCREDLAWERRSQGAPHAPCLTPDMERALTLLMPQLQPPPPPVRRRWMPWALAAQLLLIAALGTRLATQDDTQGAPRLPAAGAAAQAQAHVVVVFRPDTTEGQLRAILRQSAARVVDGPTGANAWLLAVAPATLDSALAGLRAQPAVELAEPLSPPAAN